MGGGGEGWGTRGEGIFASARRMAYTQVQVARWGWKSDTAGKVGRSGAGEV